MRVQRLAAELKGLATILQGPAFAKYLYAAAINAPQILRTRKLVPADRAMNGVIRFKTWKEDVVVDCNFIDECVRSFDPTLVFTLARELYCRNVYLRAFKPFNAAGQTVIDLGANRGLFSALAAAALTPARIVSIEPLPGYLPVLKELTGRYGVPVELVSAFVGDGVGIGNGEFKTDLGTPSVTISSLLPASERVAFAKIDIEGAEEPLLRGTISWLDQVDRVAMEVHQGYCDTGFVFCTLEEAGFTLYPSNDIGEQVDPSEAEFFYGARDRELLAQDFRPHKRVCTQPR